MALIARDVFACTHGNLRSALTETAGGQNVVRVGLAADIDFAARLDVLEAVGVVQGAEPVVRPWSG